MRQIRMIGFAAAMLTAFLMTSCAVHEWPKEAEAELMLNFEFSTDLPPYLTVTYPTKDLSTDAVDYDVRYQVKAYKQLADGSYDHDNAIKVATFTKDDVTSLDYSTVWTLPEGKWELYAWADYTYQGGEDDVFYKTGDFSGIELVSEKTANNDFKDAFLGHTEVDVVRGSSQYISINATIPMTRPLAKFQFIADDLDEFVTKVLREKLSPEEFAKYMERKNALKAQAASIRAAAAAGATSVDSTMVFSKVGEGEISVEEASKSIEDQIWNETKANGFDPSEYRIKFYYTGFMPSEFNIFDNRPSSAIMGVTFDSDFTVIGNNEALMGFDYDLVNGKESSVQLQVELSEAATGEIISRTNTIDVPIIRSKVTTVKGKFLTLGVNGGIGIDPGFDGEYNFPINL